ALVQRGGEALDRALASEDAGDAVAHGLPCSASSQRDHRRAAGLRLDGNHPEILCPRQQHGRRLLVERPDLFVCLPAQEADTGASQAFQPASLRAPADDIEPRPDALARLDREVYALVRHERGHDEEWWVSVTARC